MRRYGLPALALALLATGCKPSPPPVVEAGGKVLLNGQPLPFAVVQFVPELSGFSAEQNSTARTDEKGEFKLECQGRGKPGAVVATHRVLVQDSASEDARGDQDREAAWQAGLPNRPIPPEYSNYSKTPLRVTVEAGKTTYLVELKR